MESAVSNMSTKQEAGNRQGQAPAANPADPTVTDDVISLMRAVVRGAERQLAPYGLIRMEFVLLKAFLSQDEWTVTKLTDVLSVDAPRVSRLISRLVDRGLLRRRRSTSDRRVVQLRLTPKGRELVETTSVVVQQFEADLLQGVSARDLQAVRRVTSTVLENHATLRGRATN